MVIRFGDSGKSRLSAGGPPSGPASKKAPPPKDGGPGIPALGETISLVEKLARTSPLLAGLREEERAEVARLGEVRTLESGEVVFVRGEPGRDVFLILSGRVSVAVGEERKHGKDLLPGAVFGEMALIERAARSGTAIAAEETRLLGLRRVLAETPLPRLRKKLMMNITRQVVWNLRGADAEIERLQGLLGDCIHGGGMPARRGAA